MATSSTTTIPPQHSKPATSSTDSSNPGHEHNAKGGSPTTLDRADAGEAGKAATDGNKSPTTVAGATSANPGNANSPAGSTTPAPSDTDESPTPTEAELDAIDALEDPIEKFDAKEEILADLDEDEIDVSHDKVMRLVASLPTTTPDVTTFGGFGGVVITMGDLRNITRRHRSNI